MSVPYSAAIEDLLPDAVRRRVRAARRPGSADESNTSPIEASYAMGCPFLFRPKPGPGVRSRDGRRAAA